MQLLEREAQLQSLDDALRDVKSGVGCVTLVYGEAGIGKTSLVEHFLQAQTDSWRTLRGACDSLFTPRPLGPVHDIALQTKGTLLTLLHSGSDPAAIFAACLSELASGPTLMVVEDIHWADEATLDLLKYLGRRIRQTPSLMILTYRDDELGPEHPLRRLLGDFSASTALHRIAVPPLSRSAIQELARDSQLDAVELHRLTNGNPFYVTEVLATQGGIPETVRDAVLARAARLSPSARAALEAAAILGLRVEPWLLSRVVPADADAVEECMAAGTLQAQGDVYAFRHELARQTILDSTTPHRKVALHRLAYTALQENPATRTDLARLASHAEGSQDASAVLEYAPAAAQQASALGAHRQASDNYRTALRHASQLPPEARGKLLDLYAEECLASDQLTEAEVAEQDGLRIWRQLGRLEMQGRALRRLSEIAMRSAQEASTQRYAEEAITVLENGGASRELARAYSQKSRLHMVLFETEDAIRWGGRAMELAEALGDHEAFILALAAVGTIEMWHNLPVPGSQKLERCLQLALTNNRHDEAAMAFYDLAASFLSNYDFAACLRYVSDGLEYCAIRDLDNWRLGLWSVRVRAHFDQGDWAEVERLLGSAPRVAGELWLDSRLHLSQLRLEVRRGDPIASRSLGALRERAYAWGFLEVAFPMAATLAELAWLQGDLERCRLEAQPHYELAGQLRLPRYQGELGYWMWRAGAITKPAAAAAEPYATQIVGGWRRAAALWEQHGCPYERAMGTMDGDEAAQRQALQIFERLGARPMLDKLKRKLRSEGVRGIPRGPRPSTRDNRLGLTSRELEVLTCLVRGSSNNAIAKQLSVSIRTVEHHMTSILQKTGAQSRAEAAAFALRESLVPSK